MCCGAAYAPSRPSSGPPATACMDRLSRGKRLHTRNQHLRYHHGFSVDSPMELHCCDFWCNILDRLSAPRAARG